MGGREALHNLLPQDLCSQLLQKPQQLFLQASLKSPGLIPTGIPLTAPFTAPQIQTSAFMWRLSPGLIETRPPKPPPPPQHFP